jgi:hypothetical protein
MKRVITPLQWMKSHLTMILMLILKMVLMAKETPLKPSSKPASKVTAVNNQEALMGSLLKHPTDRPKTKAEKAAAMAATKSSNPLVGTPVSNDYSQLVASSAAIAASIRYKSKMDGLMKQAEMY